MVLSTQLLAFFSTIMPPDVEKAMDVAEIAPKAVFKLPKNTAILKQLLFREFAAPPRRISSMTGLAASLRFFG